MCCRIKPHAPPARFSEPPIILNFSLATVVLRWRPFDLSLTLSHLGLIVYCWDYQDPPNFSLSLSEWTISSSEFCVASPVTDCASSTSFCVKLVRASISEVQRCCRSASGYLIIIFFYIIFTSTCGIIYSKSTIVASLILHRSAPSFPIFSYYICLCFYPSSYSLVLHFPLPRFTHPYIRPLVSLLLPDSHRLIIIPLMTTLSFYSMLLLSSHPPALMLINVLDSVMPCSDTLFSLSQTRFDF